MGQKVHPCGLRLGIIRTWESRWYSRKQYQEFLLEDLKIRQFIDRECSSAGLSRVEIERAANRITVTIYTAKPGIVIGRGGSGVERLRTEAEQLVGKELRINVREVDQPETDAQVVAEGLAFQLSRRVAFRRAMRQAVQRTMREGALGVKVTCSGRLGGSEMARTETMKDGKIPLHTLRADISYGFTEAVTTYGHIGVKVWIYRGDILPEAPAAAEPELPASADEQEQAVAHQVTLAEQTAVSQSPAPEQSPAPVATETPATTAAPAEAVAPTEPPAHAAPAAPTAPESAIVPESVVRQETNPDADAG